MFHELAISGDAPTCHICDSDLSRGVCLRCARKLNDVRATLAMVAVQRPDRRADALHDYEVLTEHYATVTGKAVSV